MKKFILGIIARLNVISALLAIGLIGSGVAMYSGRAAMIVVGAIILLDSYWDKLRDKK